MKLQILNRISRKPQKSSTSAKITMKKTDHMTKSETPQCSPHCDPDNLDVCMSC